MSRANVKLGTPSEQQGREEPRNELVLQGETNGIVTQPWKRGRASRRGGGAGQQCARAALRMTLGLNKVIYTNTSAGCFPFLP